MSRGMASFWTFFGIVLALIGTSLLARTEGIVTGYGGVLTLGAGLGVLVGVARERA